MLGILLTHTGFLLLGFLAGRFYKNIEWITQSLPLNLNPTQNERTQPMHTQTYDWSKAKEVDLDNLYANARCLKEEVYRRWLNTLTAFYGGGTPTQQKEVARRMDYIERNLMKRFDPAEVPSD